MSNAQVRQKQWQELGARQVNLDLRMKKYALDLRNDFEDGPDGDLKFEEFVLEELHEPMLTAQRLLTLSIIAKKVPDETECNRLAVNKAITRLMSLPVSEQVDVLCTARQQNRTCGSVISIRRRVNAPKNQSVSPARVAEILNQYWDTLEVTGIPLTELSEFVARFSKTT